MEKINNIKNQISNLKRDLDKLESQVKIEIMESKPILKLEFLTSKELVDANDPLASKLGQDKIKAELKELNKLLSELWV